MGMFNETDAATLHETALEKLQDDIGESLYPGDERRIFAEGLVAILVGVYNTVDDTAKQSMLKYARNETLDCIGDTYDCQRLLAEKAKTTLIYSLNETYEADIIIPAGSRAETADGHVFATLEEAVIESGKTEVSVEACAVEGGREYNEYLVGSVNAMVDLISYVDNVSNSIKTSGGTDEEQDDDYRERIRLAMTSFSTAGPSNAYKYWAMSADTMISDANVGLVDANEIEITVILSDGSLPDEEMLAKVEKIVASDDIRPLGDKVSVKSPTEVNYDIELKYYVSSKNETEAVQAIENEKYIDGSGNERIGALETYRLWQDTKIMRNINPDKLRALLINPAGDGSVAGADRVEIISPTFKELVGSEVAHFSGMINISHEVKDEE